MIKIYKSGEKKKCPCPKCDRVTMGTFLRKNYCYRGLIIPRILQLFCDECGTFAGMPYQSGIKINSKIGAVPV